MLGGGKKAILAQSRLPVEVAVIDKILHAEVVPQPYVAAHARTYRYGSDTNAIVYLYI